MVVGPTRDDLATTRIRVAGECGGLVLIQIKTGGGIAF
jgi:hypothetical protein